VGSEVIVGRFRGHPHSTREKGKSVAFAVSDSAQIIVVGTKELDADQHGHLEHGSDGDRRGTLLDTSQSRSRDARSRRQLCFRPAPGAPGGGNLKS
jgi:hypothetical protein